MAKQKLLGRGAGNPMIGDNTRMSLLSRAEGAGGQSLVDFLRRRTMEAVGVALMLIGLAYLMALLSADSGDPSFNRAVDGTARNLLGLPGAYLADFALQALGFAAAVPAAALLAWGWRLLRMRAMPRWWLKLLLLPLATVVTAMPLAALPSTKAWPWVGGFGGFVGEIGFAGRDGSGGVVGLAHQLGIGLSAGELQAGTILLTTALAFVALFFTLGIALGGYVRFGRNVAHAGKKVGLAFDRRRQPAAAQSGVKPGARVARTARHEEDEEEKESFFKRSFGEIRMPSLKGLFTIRGRRDSADHGPRFHRPLLHPGHRARRLCPLRPQCRPCRQESRSRLRSPPPARRRPVGREAGRARGPRGAAGGRRGREGILLQAHLRRDPDSELERPVHDPRPARRGR